MSRFGKRRKAGGGQPGNEGREVVQELLDRHHPRASIVDGVRIAVDPGKVLNNIAMAMERVDLNIDVEISIEEDVAGFDEIVSLIEGLRMGPTLAVEVVNNAVRIMKPRYPADLVFRPLPAQYDVRQILPVQLDDREHDIAKTIFNQRLGSATDLVESDVAAVFEPLNTGSQLQVFLALFFMYGHKVGAIKNRTGTD